MTEIKYYYDCPIEAAYMAKTFDISFEGVWLLEKLHNPDFSNEWFLKEFYSIEIDRGTGWGCNCSLDIEVKPKYYIHADSISVINPLDKDLCIAAGDMGTVAYYRTCLNYIGGDSDKLPIQIIMRDNKSFFSPKIES